METRARLYSSCVAFAVYRAPIVSPNRFGPMLQRTYAKKPAPAVSSPSPDSNAFAPRPFVVQAKTPAPGVAMPPSADAEALGHDLDRAAIRPGGGRPIADPVRRRMEAALGHDFGSVRVHTDDARAPRIGALAFARGEHLHFAPGAYRPESAAGRRVLGHELAHVVQQRERRVRPNRPGPLPLNDEPALEREADAHAARAVHGGASRAGAGTIMAGPAAASPAPAGPVQMIPWWRKALYGAGIVGGAALAGTAALASAPLLAATGAVAAVGSGVAAYREHAGEQRAAAERRRARQQATLRAAQEAELRRTGTQRTRGDLSSLKRLHSELGRSGANPLLHQVLSETVDDRALRGVTVAGGSQHAKGESDRNDPNRGSYTARVNDAETDPTRRQSYLLHELTHVSADRKYSFNEPGRLEFINEPYVGPDDRTSGQYKTQRELVVGGQARNAQNIAAADPHLPREERDYIHGRLQYIVNKPGQEYDTVANELLLYSHRQGLPGHSPTVQEIHRLAGDAYQRRNSAYARTGP
jgi:hypothetical protein